VDEHLQPVVGQLLDLALAPLHDDHRLGQRDVEIEVLHLVQAAGEPVRVHVDERRTVAQRGVHARDHEGRGGDGATDAEALTEPAGQRRLARPELPAEHHQVTGAQQFGKAPAQLAHLVG